MPPATISIRFHLNFLGSVSWLGAENGDYSTHFFGLISTEPFTRVSFYSNTIFWAREVMFTQIPTPSAVALLVLAPLASRRRRR